MKVFDKLIWLFLPLFVACKVEHTESIEDIVTLEVKDTIMFPIDSYTFYESKAMFQFEEKGREYLFFQNRRDKGTLQLKIFDIEKECVYKNIPLYREGPNGMSAVLGGFPISLEKYIITTDTPYFYIVNDSGKIQFKSPALFDAEALRTRKSFSEYCSTYFHSYYANPGIIKDSILYFPQTQIGYPHKKDTWSKSNLFSFVDLRTGKLGTTGFCYPDIFDKEEVVMKSSYEKSHSYGFTGKDVAVSFYYSDSIYVSSDFQHVKGYCAKSRYFPCLRPKPYNAQMDLYDRLRKQADEPQYWHLIYDKYRKVFYRFALHPYEYPEGKTPMDEDCGREFSIVILNDKYERIGEVYFPGNIYNYHLCFVGKKGLYLSLNNQENPIFSEDELYFQCLELKDKNEKE